MCDTFSAANTFLSVLSQELAKYEEMENQVTLTEKGELWNQTPPTQYVKLLLLCLRSKLEFPCRTPRGWIW